MHSLRSLLLTPLENDRIHSAIGVVSSWDWLLETNCDLIFVDGIRFCDIDEPHSNLYQDAMLEIL